MLFNFTLGATLFVFVFCFFFFFVFCFCFCFCFCFSFEKTLSATLEHIQFMVFECIKIHVIPFNMN